jgi:hypothetical protein
MAASLHAFVEARQDWVSLWQICHTPAKIASVETKARWRHKKERQARRPLERACTGMCL